MQMKNPSVDSSKHRLIQIDSHGNFEEGHDFSDLTARAACSRSGTLPYKQAHVKYYLKGTTVIVAPYLSFPVHADVDVSVDMSVP